jgi:hypothetical protein
MKTLKPEEIRHVLSCGNYDALLDAVEDDSLDAKMSPYILSEPAAKYELAKDVSAFANAGGGVIVIGFRTDQLDPAHAIDTIVAVTPFPPGLLNPEQYRAVLRIWTYPPLDQIEIATYPASGGSTVAALYIPGGNGETYLTSRTISAAGKLDERHFGFAERRRAGTVHWTIEQFHATLHAGRSRDLQQLDRIEAEVGRLAETIQNGRAAGDSNQSPSTQSRDAPNPASSEHHLQSPEKPVEERMEETIIAARLQDTPLICLAAAPVTSTRVRRFLEADSVVARLVQEPPELRENGFGVTTHADGRLVGGTTRTAVLPEHKALRIDRDGYVVFVGRGDADFLAWNSRHDGTPLRINSIALAEVVLLFAKVVEKLSSDFDPMPPAMEYRLSLRRLGAGEAATTIHPSRVSSHSWQFGHKGRPAPFERADIVLPLAIDATAEVVAARLLEEIYGWFGITSEQVPYLKEGVAGREVDTDLIRSPQG